MTCSARGTLFLIPAPLDFGSAQPAPIERVLPLETLQVAARLHHWICENAKTARAVLKRIDAVVPLATPLQLQTIRELPREVHKKGDHDGQYDASPLLAPALAGEDMGLISEAGMPAVADPGASVVRASHRLGISVKPMVGPISLLLALAASGLNGQNFAFVGYLPQDADGRAVRIRDLEALASRSGQTQLFIETPYRNAALLAALLTHLKPETRLAVSGGLTMDEATTRSDTVNRWRETPSQMAPGKTTPAVFAIGR